MAFKLRSGNTTNFKSMGSSPAKQKYDLSDMTIVDKRSQEVIDKEKEEIKKEEEAKRKDQERIDQQIKGTYVETEEDVKKRKEEFRESGPRKKSPAKQNASVSDSANRGNVNTENIKILPKDNKSQKQKDFEDLATSQKNNQNAPKATVVDTTKRSINRMIQGNALASLFTGRTTKS